MGSFSGFEYPCLYFVGWGPESHSFGPCYLRWDLSYLRLAGWHPCVWWFLPADDEGEPDPFRRPLSPLAMEAGLRGQTWVRRVPPVLSSPCPDFISFCWLSYLDDLPSLRCCVWAAVFCKPFTGTNPGKKALSELPGFTQGVCDRQRARLCWVATLMPWPRKYFSSSIKAFPFSSCVVNALWWMSDEHRGAPSTRRSIPSQELFSRRCNWRSCRAPWKPAGVLPLASAKLGFYLRHTALPHSLSNVWTNRGINLLLMLVGKKWKMNFCQTGIYSSAIFNRVCIPSQEVKTSF